MPRAAAVLVLLLPPPAAAQADPWTHLRALAGEWEGPASGEPGKGVCTRSYRFELQNRFLVLRNKCVYEPKSPGASPEVHEDFGVFSFDKALGKIVFRQFHVEGFVNEYILEAAADDGKALEFVTRRIENIPPGWRAKELYRLESPDEMQEIFSLAGPGKEFQVYSQTRFRRGKP
ncbi:MAG: hypothetical protein K2X35_12880 [Bryobacteraceae bacterium]|nr:hypothetical protein [Bryobacteraceae bacterium]